MMLRQRRQFGTLPQWPSSSTSQASLLRAAQPSKHSQEPESSCDSACPVPKAFCYHWQLFLNKLRCPGNCKFHRNMFWQFLFVVIFHDSDFKNFILFSLTSLCTLYNMCAVACAGQKRASLLLGAWQIDIQNIEKPGKRKSQWKNCFHQTDM